MSSPFVAAMDSSSTSRVVGENGSRELTASGVGEARTALFAALVRGCGEVEGLFEACVVEARGDATALADLVVLAFQTRDCRGGKGERQLFGELFALVSKRVSREAALAVVPLIPDYGSWRDLCVLYEAAAGDEGLKARVVEVFAGQLRRDVAAGAKGQLSLAAKYAPREGRKFAGLGAALARALFPGDDRRKATYRKAIAGLTKALDVPEVKMCGKRWAELEIAAVPGRCLAKSRKAFLNEKLKRSGWLSAEEEETGDRFPDDADRVACREHVQRAALEKLKGARVFPHEIVKTTINARRASRLEDDVADAQWRDIVEDLRRSVDAAASDERPKSDLGKLCALVDVSGSMTGTPMEVAIALGLVVSEVAAPAFRDRVLTFESEPRWHALEKGAKPTAKIRSLLRAPWGGSTNFEAAMNLILEACIAHGLQPDDVPGLIVFSDMQFNEADRGSSWATHHERLVKDFADAGRRVCGAPWPVPEITYWNLRATAHGGFMAEHDKPGVRLLSGFSPALLKLVLTGDAADDTVVVNTDGTATKVKPTPYATMRKALDDPRYDPVRAALAGLASGAFADFAFAPPPDEDVAAMTLGDDDDAYVCV